MDLSSHGPSVPKVPSIGHRAAEALAQKVILGFEPMLLVKPAAFPAAEFFEFHLQESYQLITGAAGLPFGIEGITRPDGVIRLAEEAYEALWKGNPRARFTAVHEGVHGIVHLPILRQLNCELVEGTEGVLFRRGDIPAFMDPEWQANRIAGAILMPGPMVRQVVGQHGRNVDSLMDVFKVSFTAASVRLDQLTKLGTI